MLTVELILINPYVGITFAAGFLVYQIMEIYQLRNRGWMDVHGWLAGLGISGLMPFHLRDIIPVTIP